MSLDRDDLVRPRRLLRGPIYTMGQIYLPAFAQLEAAFEEIGLTPRAYLLLVCVDELGGISQQQASNLVRVDRSDMVRIVDRLEERGLLLRNRDATDRRRHVLTLTRAGRDAIKAGREVVARTTDTVFARLSAPEHEQLLRLMHRALGEPSDILDQPETETEG